MSIKVLVDLLLILAKIMILVECAPKIGPILLDPLNFTKAHITKGSPGNTENNLESNKYNQVKMALDLTVENTESAENIAKEQGSKEFAQVENVSETSLEWLINPGSESAEKKTSKPVLTNASQAENDTKSFDILPAIGNESDPINKQNIMQLSNIASLSETGTTKHDNSIMTLDKLMKMLRSVGSQEKVNVGSSNGFNLRNLESPWKGYDYDGTKCQYYGDRYLCGYNKNTGDFKDTEVNEEMNNGCRTRGDRMECGYKDGPFDHGKW